MERKKNYRKYLCIALFLNIIAIAISFASNYNEKLPNNIKVMAGKESNFHFQIPASGVLYGNDVEAMSSAKVNLSKPFSIASEATGSYTFQVKLWGVFNLKKVKVDVIETEKVIPGGNQIGIFVQTNGVLVLDTQVITATDGLNYEPAKNILQSGDYIKKVNGTIVNSKEELTQIVDKEGSSPLIMEIQRGEETQKVKIQAVESKQDNTYKMGVWVRDDTQGIGTLTYISGDKFGALGHGIHDVDTGEMMEVEDGYIFDTNILSLVKGKDGSPGEIVGVVCYDYENPYGEITKNTNYGIYGTVKNQEDMNIKNQEVEIGLKQEVKPGKAYIRSSIDGESKDYEIEIESVDFTNKNFAKGMVIKITDERLVSMTNGIIQGMSGTPILQNGKLIGAVTHVFIQDSTKGYGTFVENMLKESNGE